MIERKWIVENGIGHWEVTNGRTTLSCDDDELNEVIKELEEEEN